MFLIAMDNGKRVIARIPFPVAGPPHLMTASEVATMDYARSILEIPVPEVLAWSSRASSTPVGCEFIIMEHLNGLTLSKRAQVFQSGELSPCVDAVAKMLAQFSFVRFSQIGSIYFKEDVSAEL